MITKITLHNFMSHRHTVIQPASGLTVLAGENNCGKSAVVAALQILCNNAMGEYMVRHGQTDCKITVETADGDVVEWRRENGTVSYSLNGKAYYRLRGDLPDDLHRLLRLPQVFPQDGGAAFDVHFGEQKKPVFLLDEPGGRAAKFFASSSDAESLIRMQQLHARKVRDASGRTKELQGQVDGIDRRLRPLEAVDGVQSRLDALESDYEALLVAQSTAAILKQAIDDLAKAQYAVSQRKAETGVLSALEMPPPVRDTGPLAELSETLSSCLTTNSRNRVKKQTLDRLQAPPRLADIYPVEQLISSIAVTLHKVSRLVEGEKALSSLSAPPSLKRTENLETLCVQVALWAGQVLHDDERAKSVAQLQTPPNLFDVRPLSTFK